MKTLSWNRVARIIGLLILIGLFTSCATTITTETKETYNKVYKTTHLLPPKSAFSENLPYTVDIRVDKEKTLYEKDDRGDEYRFQAGLRLSEAVQYYLAPMFVGKEHANILIEINAPHLQMSHQRKTGSLKYLTCHNINISAVLYIDGNIASDINSIGDYCGDETGFKPREDALYLAIVSGIEKLRPKIYEAIVFPEKEKTRYEALIHQEPNNPRIALILAHLSLIAKDFNQAIAASKRVIELINHPKSLPIPFDLVFADERSRNTFFSKAYTFLGLSYKELEQHTPAIENLKKGLEFSPNEISGYTYLSELYEDLEDYIAVVDLWKKASASDPNNPDLYFMQARAYAALGKYDIAISLANKAIDLSTITGIGVTISTIENYPVVLKVSESGPANKAGIEVGDKIVKVNGQTTEGWDLQEFSQNVRGNEGTQAVLTIERKGSGKIEKTLTREKMIQKEAAPPLGLRSLVYAITGESEQSFKDAELVYPLDPTNEWAKRAISFFSIQKGANTDKAIELLSSSKDNFDKLLESLAYSKKGDLENSVKIYASIPDGYLNSKSIFKQDFKNIVFQSLKPYVENKRRKIKSLEAENRHRDALKVYAELMMFADENEKKQIRSDIASILKIKPYLLEFPEEARRYAIRAEAWTSEGKFKEAVEEYRKALDISPFFPELYKAIALNYEGLKEYSKAIDYMGIYVEIYPDAPDYREAKDLIYKWEALEEKERSRKGSAK